jgi:lipopolysaccharide/colanic/teichoic acid biosynthesis glycosyltransferase
MSVVGPRPERPHFVQKFLQEVGRYNNRHCLKVGMTGWTQVNVWRGDTSIEKRVWLGLANHRHDDLIRTDQPERVLRNSLLFVCFDMLVL